jgi:hypothetical protein
MQSIVNATIRTREFDQLIIFNSSIITFLI